MKIHILSDVHNEFEQFIPPETDADVVVLAGDIHVGRKGIEWALSTFPDQIIIYVLGNHEYYGQAIPKHIHDLKVLTQGSHLHILERDALQIEGVRFLGCTLWTDFELWGDPAMAGYEANQAMTDYRRIRVNPGYRKLRSRDTSLLHQQSLRWMQEELEAASHSESNTPVVIVTHHAPSLKSVPESFQADILSCAYASHLDAFVSQSLAKFWIHGHLHSQNDYWIGQTRVLSNPRGYPDGRNPQFQPGFVVEV